MRTADFVTAVRREAQLPSVSVADADILGAGDLVVQGRVVPFLRAAGSEFMVRTESVTPDSNGRARLPLRAVGASTRLVQLVQGSSRYTLPLYGPESDTGQVGSPPFGYYMDAGSIVLLPAASAGTLLVRYEARPGRMVLSTDLTKAVIVSIVTAGATTTTVHLTGSLLGGVGLDCVTSGPAHEIIGLNFDMSSLGGDDFLVTNADFINQPVIGDWFCYADTTPFVPVPEELTAAVILLTASDMLDALGYGQEAAARGKRGDALIEAAKDAVTPRNEGNARRWMGGMRRALRWF